MELKTRVFELSTRRYKNLSELAQVMGISTGQVYRVRQGKRSINQKFIVGATKAFPDYKLDDLFYLTPNGKAVTQPKQKLSADSILSPDNVLRPHKDLASKTGGRKGKGKNGNRERPITYAEIARRLGISRERVGQIANRQKLNRQSKVTISSRINEATSRMDTMLTTREVAQLLNLHINTVRRWSNRGILKAYRVGTRGDRRFRQQVIDSFLSKKSRASKRS